MLAWKLTRSEEPAPAAMESFKLFFLRLSLAPFLLLAAVDGAVSGDELTTFIVHVQPQEGHVLATADDRKAWYTSFLPEDGRLVHAYHHVASGFAARLTPEELDEVSAMPGFVGAVADKTCQVQTTHTPLFLGLDDYARQDKAAASGSHGSGRGGGAGVIIGMIDTGVLPSHPSFADDGMPPPPARWKGRCDFHGQGLTCNNKLIGARSLVSWSNSSMDTSPIDDLGHGTHTASTAAGAVVPGAQVLGQGYGVATGMAPLAHVAVYKVCTKKDCLLSDILAGVDAAVHDGCDVISMSLASDSGPFHQDPFAIGTFGATEKGVFVSMAAANSGPNASSVLNEAPWMLTVAASTMDRSIRATVRLGNGLFFHGESLYQPAASPSVFHPLVYAGASGKPSAEFCGNGSLEGLDVRGKIVLCEFGLGPDHNISTIVKGEVVKSAGGVGMIVANQFAQGHDTFALAHILPASNVDYAAGEAIKSYISSTQDAVAQILFRGTVLGTSPAPSVAFFSSRGPSLQNPGILKPDVTGPGVNVLAAWPFQVGGPPSSPPRQGPYFNIISGTSMSTPHLSGIAALVKSRHPDWSPAAIKSAIMTTADVTDRAGNPILTEQRVPADWFATGAGHVNPDKAADPGLVYDIATGDYIGYLCGMYTSQEVSVIARRRVDCAAVRVIQQSMLNYPSITVVFPQAWNRSAPAVVERTVKNVGEAPSAYYAAVDILDEDDVTIGVFPRELVFTEVNQEQSLKVIVWPKQKNGAKVVQGALRWVSEKHTVRSPISISFA